MKKNDIFLILLVVLLSIGNFVAVLWTSHNSKKQREKFCKDLILASTQILRKEVSKEKADEQKPVDNTDAIANTTTGADLSVSVDGVHDSADLSRFNYRRYVDRGRICLDWAGDIFEEGDFIPSIGQVAKIYNNFIILSNGKVIYNNFHQSSSFDGGPHFAGIKDSSNDDNDT